MKNREIKFRVWDKKNNRWLRQLSLGGFNPKIAVMDGVDSFFDEIKSYHKNDENLVYQQFTGIFDSNIKEIYEGDIVRYEISNMVEKSRNAEVWWDEEYAMFCFDRKYEFTFIDKVQTMEVVGSIFETPDLLE